MAVGSLTFAAVEAFAALLVVTLASTFFSNAAASVLPAFPSSLRGPLQVAVVAAVLTLGYSTRFRPHETHGQAARSSFAKLLQSLTPHVPPTVALVLAFHGAQAALIWLLASRPSVSQLFSCAAADGLLWGPLFEECFSRFLLFYVALQRSGGQMLFSVAVGAFIFSVMHLANFVNQPQNVLVLLQALVGLVAGMTYGTLFACTGSLFAVFLLHAANNAVAYAWMSTDASGETPCTSQYSTGLLVFLCAQLVVYAAVGAHTFRHTAARLQTPAGEADFRRKHALLYDGAAAPPVGRLPEAATTPPPAAAAPVGTGAELRALKDKKAR